MTLVLAFAVAVFLDPIRAVMALAFAIWTRGTPRQDLWWYAIIAAVAIYWIGVLLVVMLDPNRQWFAEAIIGGHIGAMAQVAVLCGVVSLFRRKPNHL